MYIFFALLAVWAVFDIYRGWRKTKLKDRSGYLVKTSLGTAGVLLALFLFGPFFMISPLKLGYSLMTDPGLKLYYPSARSSRAREILDMARWARDQNDQFYRRQTQTTILVATNDLDMLRFGVYPKGNGGGIPWGVVIRDVKASPNIIAHEMSHKNLANSNLLQAGTIAYPRWFDEGLANYLGKMDYYDDLPELRETLAEGRYQRDITDWKGVRGNVTWIYQTFYGVGPRILYGQTYQMMKSLFDTYGEEKVYEVVARVRRISFEKAFTQTFGKTPEAFHREFIADTLAN